MTTGPTDQTCATCKIAFPEGKRFVAPFVIEGGKTVNMCSLCALEITRRVHNNPKYYFQTKANRKRHRKTVALLTQRGVHVPDKLRVQTF